MRAFLTLLFLISFYPAFGCDCPYDPLERLAQCMDNSETYIGNAKPDKTGDISEDPWFAKKIVNDAKCHKLSVDIYNDKKKKVECSYVKEEHQHRCKLVEPEDDEDDEEEDD